MFFLISKMTFQSWKLTWWNTRPSLGLIGIPGAPIGIELWSKAEVLGGSVSLATSRERPIGSMGQSTCNTGYLIQIVPFPMRTGQTKCERMSMSLHASLNVSLCLCLPLYLSVSDSVCSLIFLGLSFCFYSLSMSLRLSTCKYVVLRLLFFWCLSAPLYVSQWKRKPVSLSHCLFLYVFLSLK